MHPILSDLIRRLRCKHQVCSFLMSTLFNLSVVLACLTLCCVHCVGHVETEQSVSCDQGKPTCCQRRSCVESVWRAQAVRRIPGLSIGHWRHRTPPQHDGYKRDLFQFWQQHHYGVPDQHQRWVPVNKTPGLQEIRMSYVD